MKLGGGLVVVGVLALAVSCGKSGSGDGDDDGGSSGKVTAGAPGSGNGGSSAGSGTGAGMGGSTSGSGPQGGSAGGGNATSAAGAGGNAGTSTTSAGAGGTAGSAAGAGGESDAAGAAGASGGGNPAGALTLMVMFDRSWSMNECGDGTETQIINNNEIDCPTVTRWDLTSAALVQFFQDPAAAGLNVALRFFPDDQPGCSGFPDSGTIPPPPVDAGTPPPPEPNCDIAVCAEPLVQAAPLSAEPAPTDAHEANLVAAIMASVPAGPAMPNPNPQTPTYPALAGAEQWAVAYRQAHPDEPTAVVLITDGEPQGCVTDTTQIANLAADANTTAGVRTYVVGLTGSSESSLNAIAKAGGTGKGFYVSDGSTAVQDLFDALSTIRASGP